MTTSVASSDRSGRSRRRTKRLAVAGVAALAVTNLAACGGQASEPAAYPEKEITFVVPFAAGGPTDTVTRTWWDWYGMGEAATLVRSRSASTLAPSAVVSRACGACVSVS